MQSVGAILISPAVVDAVVYASSRNGNVESLL